MKTDTTSTDTYDISNEISTTIIFDLLSNRRRRYALYYLSQKVGAVELSDLAEQVSFWEGNSTRDRFERVCTGLFHVHLPKLEGTGIIRYDVDRGTVELTDAADQLSSYLELAAADDFQ